MEAPFEFLHFLLIKLHASSLLVYRDDVQNRQNSCETGDEFRTQRYEFRRGFALTGKTAGAKPLGFCTPWIEVAFGPSSKESHTFLIAALF